LPVSRRLCRVGGVFDAGEPRGGVIAPAFPARCATR
jgi:hypothetical protein